MTGGPGNQWKAINSSSEKFSECELGLFPGGAKVHPWGAPRDSSLLQWALMLV